MLDGQLPERLCPHLVVDSGSYCIWFTGHGKLFNWACESCAKKFPKQPDSWAPLDAGLQKVILENSYCGGVCGRPEVLVRVSPLAFEHSEWAFLADKESLILDAQPFPKPDYWCILLSTSEVRIVNSAERTCVQSLTLPALGFALSPETGLHVSPCGAYVFVYQASGALGALIRLDEGVVVRGVSRGDYRPANSFFPAAFWVYRARTLLVAGTDWNRLDIIDCMSGNVLTERGPHSYQDGVAPPHYLDYFHGTLTVSQESGLIADGGWVWHPVGIIRSWSLESWLQNPWESEDGDSVRGLAYRDYFWDSPMCWVNGSTLAVWGLGDDDAWMVDAVLLIDTTTGKTLSWFAGPQVRRPGAWPPRTLAKSLFYDEYLYSVSAEAGISVWDIESGERLLSDEKFAPSSYHPNSREFVAILSSGLRFSKLVGTKPTY